MQPIIFDFNGTMFLDSAENEAAWRKEIKGICDKDISDEEFKSFVHAFSQSLQPTQESDTLNFIGFFIVLIQLAKVPIGQKEHQVR